MDTKYAGTLRSSRKDKRLGYSDNIYDEELGAMQSELNKRFGEKGDASKIYDNEQGKTQAEINKEANGYFYGVSVSTSDGNTTLSMSSRNGDKSVSLLGKLLTSINGSSLGGKLPSGNGYLRYSNGTWEMGNPSVSGGGGAALGGFLTKLNADNPSLLENGFLTYRNGSFYMVEVKADGGGSSSGGSVSQDQIDTAVKDALSNYSWWGRYFASGNNSITGALIGVPSIQFNNGKNVEKLLYLDDNGDLYFDGNFYATGGITALGQTSGGGSSGGGSGGDSVGTLSNALTIYNSNGVGWGFDGSSPLGLKFGEGLSASVSNDIITVSSTGGSGGGISGVQCYLNGVEVGTFSKMYFLGNVEVSKNSYDANMANIKVTGGGTSSGGSATNPYMLFFYGSGTANGTPSLVDGYDGSSVKYLQFKGSGVRTYTGTTNSSGDTTIVEITGGGSSGGSSVDLSDYLKKTDASAMYLGVNGTAKSASKLATARSIWGQTFDGTNNVSGNLSGVGDISVSKSTFILSADGKTLMGLNSNKDLYFGYGYYEDTDANTHITLYGSKTLINTYDGANHHNFWFKENYLSMPDDGELRIGNGKLVWDETNKAFRMTSVDGGNCNFYCDGGITALGVQSTSASNSDFTFKNVNVKEKLYIGGTDKYFMPSGSDIDLHMDDGGTFYFDNGSESYGLVSDGSAYINNLDVDGYVNMAGVGDLRITKSGNGFIMSFTIDGKTYKFQPSESYITIS